MNNLSLLGQIGTVFYLHFDVNRGWWQVLSSQNAVRAQPICPGLSTRGHVPLTLVSRGRHAPAAAVAADNATDFTSTDASTHDSAPEDSPIETDVIRRLSEVDTPLSLLHVLSPADLSRSSYVVPVFGVSVALVVIMALVMRGRERAKHTTALAVDGKDSPFMQDLKHARELLRSLSAESEDCFTQRSTLKKVIRNDARPDVTIESWGGMRTKCLRDGSIIFRSSSSDIDVGIGRSLSSERQFSIQFRGGVSDYVGDWLEAPISRSLSEDTNDTRKKHMDAVWGVHATSGEPWTKAADSPKLV